MSTPDEQPERSELWHMTQALIAEHGEQYVHNLAVEAEIEQYRAKRGERTLQRFERQNQRA